MMGWLGDACPSLRATGVHEAPLDRVCLSRPDREVRASQEVPLQGFSTGPWAQTAARVLRTPAWEGSHSDRAIPPMPDLARVRRHIPFSHARSFSSAIRNTWGRCISPSARALMLGGVDTL
jgi:hypothetical protein